MDGMQEKLRRVERIATGEEPITQKQAVLLLLDLVAGVYDEISPVIKQVPLNTTEIEVLGGKVKLGIGLTVAVGIAMALIAIFV